MRDLKFQLIPNWKKSIRLYSQQAFIIATALQGGRLLLDGHQNPSKT